MIFQWSTTAKGVKRSRWSIPIGAGDDRSIEANLKSMGDDIAADLYLSIRGLSSENLPIPIVHGFPQPSQKRFYTFFCLHLAGNSRARKKEKKD